MSTLDFTESMWVQGFSFHTVTSNNRNYHLITAYYVPVLSPAPHGLHYRLLVATVSVGGTSRYPLYFTREEVEAERRKTPCSGSSAELQAELAFRLGSGPLSTMLSR